MAYTLIDEKRDIWSCRLADLTFEEVQKYTKSLGEDVPLGELAFFLDSKTGRIVLNEENGSFTQHKFQVIHFLALDKSKRTEIIKEYSENSIVKCLAAAVGVREALQIEKIVNNYPVYGKDYAPGEFAMDSLVRQNPRAFKALYEYGFIQGKRSERARKKKESSKDRQKGELE